MHRFGRSAQQKMKDRWGGSFILATILALVGAYFAGNWLNDNLNGKTAGLDTRTPGLVGNQTGAGTGILTPGSAAMGAENKLYAVQVAALRSDAGARNLVKALSDQGYIAMAAPKVNGLTKVYAGMFTSMTSATDAKVKLMADGAVKEAIAVTLPINTSMAVPVAAMNVKGGPDLQKGLEAMNNYIFEVANWIEAQQAGGTGDVTMIKQAGDQLNKFASDLAKVATADPNLQPLADLAARASTNANEIQNAAKAGPGSNDFQVAMNGYLSLLDQYNNLHQTAAVTP